MRRNALTSNEIGEIKNARVTAIIYGANGVRVLTASGLNYKRALETVIFQNSIGRVVLIVPDDVPHAFGLIRHLDKAREAIEGLGRRDEFRYGQKG